MRRQPNAGLFESEEAKKVLHSALPTLSGLATTFRNAPLPLGPAQDPAKEFETTRIFDVDVAKVNILLHCMEKLGDTDPTTHPQTLLMLSALVYERLDEVTSLSYEYAKLGKNEEANTLRRLSVQYIRLRESPALSSSDGKQLILRPLRLVIWAFASRR